MHNNCLSRNENKELLFFCSYIIFIGYNIFCNSFFLQYIEGYWKYCILLCGMMIIAHELIFFKLSYKELIILIVISGMCLLILLSAGGVQQNSVAMMFIYAYTGRNISFGKIARVTIYTSGICLVVIICSSLVGIIPNYVEHSDYRYREYLGFLYALFAPTILANITALYVYIKKETLTWLHFGVLIVMNTLLYVKTDSRLTYFMSVLLLIIAMLIRKKPNVLLKSKVISFCMVCSYLICAITSYYVTVIYDASIHWMVKLNDILGGRLYLGQTSLKNEGITLTGNSKLNLVGNGLDMYGRKSTNLYNYVDCFYIQVTQRFGIVFFVIFIMLITVVLYKCLLSKNVYYLMIMATIAVHCMIDDLLFYPYNNTLWIAMVGILIGMNENNSNKKKKFLNLGKNRNTIGLL